MTARSVGRFFKTEGNSLERAYKHHLSNFEQWDQKAHAEDWVLLAENLGEKMSIDETMLCDDLFTFLSNKAGKGKHGTLAAAVRGTTTDRKGIICHSEILRTSITIITDLCAHISIFYAFFVNSLIIRK